MAKFCSESVLTVTRSTGRPEPVRVVLPGSVNFSRIGESILHGPHQLLQ